MPDKIIREEFYYYITPIRAIHIMVNEGVITMSMPQIPEHKHRPSCRCVTIDLLESIALEEISLSHLLNAEAEKIQAFVGEELNFPFCTSMNQVIEFSRISTDFMEKIIMKQWLLLNKLNKVMDIECEHKEKECEHKEHKSCNDCMRPMKRLCKDQD